MLKFQCSHCGGRLAIQECHLGRLAHCPECGGITHPMAAQIIARQKIQKKIECGNCGLPLGKLQKPRRWGRSIVCAPCHRALSMEESAQGPAANESRLQPSSARASVVTVQTLPRRRTVRSMAGESQRCLPSPGKDPSSAAFLPAELGVAARTALIGLVLCAATVIVATYVLRAIGSLLLWSVGAALVVLAIALVAWGVMVLRRKFSAAQDRPPAVALAGVGSLIRGLLRSPAAQQAARTGLLVLISGGIYLMYLIGSAAFPRGEPR